MTGDPGSDKTCVCSVGSASTTKSCPVVRSRIVYFCMRQGHFASLCQPRSAAQPADKGVLVAEIPHCVSDAKHCVLQPCGTQVINYQHIRLRHCQESHLYLCRGSMSCALLDSLTDRIAGECSRAISYLLDCHGTACIQVLDENLLFSRIYGYRGASLMLSFARLKSRCLGLFT